MNFSHMHQENSKDSANHDQHTESEAPNSRGFPVCRSRSDRSVELQYNHSNSIPIGSHALSTSCTLRGYSKSRNGEMRNEKLEMRKWKRKWKWSSLDATGAQVADQFHSHGFYDTIKVCTSSTHLIPAVVCLFTEVQSEGVCSYTTLRVRALPSITVADSKGPASFYTFQIYDSKGQLGEGYAFSDPYV